MRKMAASPLIDLAPLAALLSQSLTALQALLTAIPPPVMLISDPAARPLAFEGLNHALESVELTLSAFHELKNADRWDVLCVVVAPCRAGLVNAKAAVTALPDETLAAIFEFILMEPVGRVAIPHIDPKLHLMHVCSRWGTVCRGRAEFWAALTF